MIEIYAGSTLIQNIKKVITANLRETLEGEFTLSFTVLAKSALALKVKQYAKLDNQYFEIVQISKNVQSGLPICAAICEHISYSLNHDMYKIDTFDFTGTPLLGLGEVLSGTPFVPGVVEFTENVTMKINQSVTRRAALMQYIAILGGEIEYDGYQINIRSHRGSNTYKQVMDSKNVTSVAVSYDSRENSAAYDISFFKLLNLMVGDNLRIVFKPLGIDVKTRIISLEYNPFYRYDIRVEVGRYRPSISETFYRIENSLSTVGNSVDDIQNQVYDLGISYTTVSNIVITETTIDVTYTVEKGDTHQYHATYQYVVGTDGRITSITLANIYSELLLKEVYSLAVDLASFYIEYADGTSAVYDYITDTNGRITSITLVGE